jgi:hypothetical protein
VVDLRQPMKAQAEPALTTASPPPAVARSAASAPAVLAEALPEPTWRQDSRTWLAEIERLRATGEHEQAEAEMAEYKLRNRAYAGSPDR